MELNYDTWHRCSLSSKGVACYISKSPGQRSVAILVLLYISGLLYY